MVLRLCRNRWDVRDKKIDDKIENKENDYESLGKSEVKGS